MNQETINKAKEHIVMANFYLHKGDLLAVLERLRSARKLIEAEDAPSGGDIE